MTETKKKWELAYEAKLLELFTALMQEMGGVRKPGYLNVWDLNTTVGPLRLTCYNDWIPGRFENRELARKVVDCNPYSGKWNYHTFWSQTTREQAPTPAEVIDMMRRRLCKVWNSEVTPLVGPAPPTELETELKNVLLTIHTKDVGHTAWELMDALKRLVSAVQINEGVSRRLEVAKSILTDAEKLLK